MDVIFRSVACEVLVYHRKRPENIFIQRFKSLAEV